MLAYETKWQGFNVDHKYRLLRQKFLVICQNEDFTMLFSKI